MSLKNKEKDTALQTRQIFTVVTVFVFLLLFGFVLSGEMERFTALVQEHAFWGAVVYVLVLASGVVLVPFSSTPVSMISEQIWGFVFAGMLSGFAWWLGAMIMFFLARWLGRPLFDHFFSSQQVEKIENALTGTGLRAFFVVVFAHMVIPVEIVSFAAGVSRKVSFWIYAPASLLGIMTMAFVIVGLGGAILSLEWRNGIVFAFLAILVFLGGRAFLQKYLMKK